MSRVVGREAVRGDPAAIRRVADLFDGVASEATSVLTRLRNIGAATGEECWRGDAATAFRDRLGELVPGVQRLVDAHQEARNALWGFADALGQAQDTDRRAESNAESAASDRDRAAGDRAAAGERAAGAEAAARAAAAAVRQAHLLQFQASATGQVQWHAQLVTYEQQEAAVQRGAQQQAAEARGAERAAGQLEDAAKARLAAAKVLADQAAFTRDVSAQATVRRLDEAGRTGLVGAGFLSRTWAGLTDAVRGFATSPAFLAALHLVDTVGTVVGIIAAVVGAIAAVVAIVVGGAPVLAVVGVITAVLGIIVTTIGAVVLAFDVLGAVGGKGNWVDVVWDTLSLRVPGAKSAGKTAGEDEKTAEKTERSAAAVVKQLLREPGGEVKRFIYFDDARRAPGPLRAIKAAPKPKFKGFERRLAKGVHLSPKAYFRIHVVIEVIKDAHEDWERAQKVLELGQKALPYVAPIVRPLPVLSPLVPLAPPLRA